MKLLNELQDLLAAALKEDGNTNDNDDVTTASTLEVKILSGRNHDSIAQQCQFHEP